ncbi:MAG: nucleotidyltransferase family protein [Candidatus Hydrothermarchaeales archaeon]
MKTRDEILKALSKELPKLKENFNVKKIGLFGSYARGEQREESDIDLLADFEPAIDYFTLFELEERLSKILGAKVEIVTPGALKEIIKPYIMQDLVYA